MNSVDKIMKVNQLAQDLLNQGIVSSRDEAVKKAEEMLDTSIVKSEVANDGNEQQVVPAENKEAPAEAQSQETAPAEPAPAPAAPQQNNGDVEKLYGFVKQQFAVFGDNLKTLNNKIEALQTEVDFLKNKVKSQPAAPAQNQSAPSQSPAQEEKKEGGNMPRTGATNPDDVSIDKMFYFGNK